MVLTETDKAMLAHLEEISELCKDTECDKCVLFSRYKHCFLRTDAIYNSGMWSSPKTWKSMEDFDGLKLYKKIRENEER